MRPLAMMITVHSWMYLVLIDRNMSIVYFDDDDNILSFEVKCVTMLQTC